MGVEERPDRSIAFAGPAAAVEQVRDFVEVGERQFDDAAAEPLQADEGGLVGLLHRRSPRKTRSACAGTPTRTTGGRRPKVRVGNERK